MLFGYLTLVTALAISISAGVYSVIGLTAIFSGAFWPIVIMGGTLEVGKIVTTLWLHKYWERAERRYKVYLSSAVAVLMALTSMGVFGYLSKAHTEAGVTSGDVQAQVSLYDEKIKTQRDNIDAARRALTQMDAAVDQTMGRSTTETGADKAVSIRRAQAKERTKLQNEISAAQTQIVKLQEERAPFAAQYRKVEAEVGPIKYIAAMIYGDNADATALEHAVRWVIILIVIVFDPLALTLLLAATKTFEWERGDRKEQSWDNFFNSPPAPDDFDPRSDEPVAEPEVDLEELAQREEAESARLANQLAAEIEPEEPLVENIVTDEDESDLAEEANLLIAECESSEYVLENIVAEEVVENEVNALAEKLTHLERDNAALQSEMTQLVETMAAERRERARKRRAKHRTTKPAETPVLDVDALPKQIEANHEAQEQSVDYLVDLQPQPDNQPVISHGDSFPQNPSLGDMCIRTDAVPTRMFKWTGDNWIELDKNDINVPLHNEYVDHLIDQIMTAGYDLEHLSEVEREHIAERLGQK